MDEELSAIDVYLQGLFGRARPSTLIEVRWRTAAGMARRFVPSAEQARLRHAVLELGARSDVYVGALPRWRPRGGRDSVAGDGRTVWVDLDQPFALRALEPVDPAPSLIVASGAPGHVHAYWSLRRAVPPQVIERANRRLAWALGGDLQSRDAARILRPPQTRNHGRAGARVQLVATGGGAAVALAVLIGGLLDPPSPAPVRTRTRRRARTGDELLGVDPARYVTALTGQAVGRTRKVLCPLHEDRTPSLHVFPDPGQGWFCFGCRRGGSIHDLAGAVWLSGQSSGAGAAALRGREFVEVRERLLGMLCGERGVARARHRLVSTP